LPRCKHRTFCQRRKYLPMVAFGRTKLHELCISPTASPASTTTYTVTGTASSGCSNTASVTVTVLSAPVVNAGSNLSICAGESAQLNASGATSYSWSPSLSLSCSTCPSPVADPSSTTTYVVTGSNSAGCTAADAVTVTVFALPVAAAGADVLLCSGDTSMLSGSGGSAYQWSPSVGLGCATCASTSLYPASTTVYSLVVTNANGCSASDNVTVTVAPLPVANAGADVSVCEGTSTTLNASGGTVFSWTPAGGLSCTNCPAPVATPSLTTTYTLNVTDNNGCSNTDNVTVTVNQLPVAFAGNDAAFCAGASVTLNASGGNSYSWSPSAGLSCTSCPAPVASPSVTTTYTVDVTDGNGCSNTDDVTITVHQLPVAFAGNDDAFCAGASVTLNASGGTTYSWSPAAGLSCTNCPAPVASPSVTTTYTLDVTDINGCSNSDDVTITVHQLPVAFAGNDTSFCEGENVMLTATGGSSYSWSPAGGLSCTACQSPDASPLASTAYTVVVTDVNGCINSASVQLNVWTLPVVSAGADASICEGDTIALNASGAASYTWTSAGPLSCTNCQSPDAWPTATALYTVTGVDVNGCNNTDAVTINVNPLPVANAGIDDAICMGETVLLQGSGGINYLWSPAAALSCTACQDPSATPDSTTNYTLLVTDANGCMATDDVLITVTICTSVEEEGGTHTTVFINPSLQQVIISSINVIGQVELFSLRGELVFQEFGLKKNNFEFSTHPLARGIYLLRVQTTLGSVVKKIAVN
jgi:hypothetical protein